MPETPPRPALATQHCQPCAAGTPPLAIDEAQRYLTQLQGWELVDKMLLRKSLKMANFMAAVQLINRIAALAEADDHHPDLHLTGYRRLVIELSTHAIGGLSVNDFILAAKIDQLPIN